MKKILGFAAAILAASLAFVACSNGVPLEAAPTPPTPETPAAETECVVFDPASYTGNVGTVVENDGVKYLEVTPNNYGTVIELGSSVDLSSKTKFKVKLYAKAGQAKNATSQYFVSLQDADGAFIANPGMYKPLPETPTEYEVGHFEETQWNKASTTNVCVKLQPVVQENGGSYAAQDDVVVYIGKIIAE